MTISLTVLHCCTYRILRGKMFRKNVGRGFGKFEVGFGIWPWNKSVRAIWLDSEWIWVFLSLIHKSLMQQKNFSWGNWCSKKQAGSFAYYSWRRAKWRESAIPKDTLEFVWSRLQQRCHLFWLNISLRKKVRHCIGCQSKPDTKAFRWQWSYSGIFRNSRNPNLWTRRRCNLWSCRFGWILGGRNWMDTGCCI